MYIKTYILKKNNGILITHQQNVFWCVCVSENGYARHMAVSIWKMMRIDHQMLGQPGNAIIGPVSSAKGKSSFHYMPRFWYSKHIETAKEQRQNTPSQTSVIILQTITLDACQLDSTYERQLGKSLSSCCRFLRIFQSDNA